MSNQRKGNDIIKSVLPLNAAPKAIVNNETPDIFSDFRNENIIYIVL